MITDDINLDRLLDDIDQQLEILTAIAGDNPILSEQLRVLGEARDSLVSQSLEIGRLAELIDPDNLVDHATVIDRFSDRADQADEA